MIMMAQRYSLLRQIVWAVTLATGFGTLWLVLAIWLGTSLPDLRQAGNRPPYESLVVKSDGTILIQSMPPSNLSEASYRNLSGQQQEAPDRNDQLSAVYSSWVSMKTAFPRSELGWESRLMTFVNEREPTANWFFVRDEKPDGAGYFVAYERKSNRRIGFIGMSGFRTDPVPRADWIPAAGELDTSLPISIHPGRRWVVKPDRWDVPPRWVYVSSANLLRKVDLDAGTVRTILETREPIVAPGVPRIAGWSTGNPTKEKHVFVGTARQIHELDQQDRVIRVFTIPTEVDPRSSVQWYVIDSGQAIAVFGPPASIRQSDTVAKELVYRFASDGAIEDQFEVSLQTGSTPLSKQAQAFLLILAVPAPAVVVVVTLLQALWTDQIEGSSAVLTAVLTDSAPSLIAVLALSVILARMAWRRSRAFGLSRQGQIAWAVFVLLFGLPAYVGFLLYRRWPIRQPCPKCQTQVPRDRVACAECGTLFPEPALKGIEIFA
jgi:hypothetical protein